MVMRKTCLVFGVTCLLAAGACHVAAEDYQKGQRSGLPAPVVSKLLEKIRADGDQVAVAFAIAGGTFLAAGMSGNGGAVNTARERVADVLLWWTQQDAFTLQQLLNGGCAIMGRTGSGKTSGSGLAIAKGLARCRTGGLILGSKPEDPAFWKRVFAAAGRSQDLLIFDAASPLRFNLLDEELRSGADTREITQCILTVSETLNRAQQGRAKSEAFWERLKERLIYNAVGVVRKATGRVTAPDLQRFIVGAANSPEELKNDDWKRGFHNKCLALAFYAQKTPVEEHDYQQEMDFWLREYPVMDQKPRSSSLADVLGVLHVWNTGTVRQLLSEKTNVSPAVMEQGKWVLVNMPVHERGAEGAFVNAAWKFAAQRFILRRHALHEAPAIIIWSDEFQNVCNGFDATFLAECRSHRGALVVLTQSIHSFYSAMADETGRHKAQSLLTNFSTKVFHALGSDEDATYAASLLGKSLQTFTGGSMGPPGELWDQMMGQSKFSGSFNEHYEQVLQNNVFMNGLKSGGKANGYMVDGIVIRSGEPFSHGENWLRCSFDQRG